MTGQPAADSGLAATSEPGAALDARICDLWFVRHGESESNARGRVQGWLDSPLTARGRDAVFAAAARLAHAQATGQVPRFLAVVTSDLCRAADTGRLLAGATGVSEQDLIVDARLREYDTGAWSDLTTGEIDQRWPGQLTMWRAGTLAAPPGGETRAAFAQRARSALCDIVARYGTSAVLVVGHGGMLRSLERRAGLPARPLPNLAGRRLFSAPDGSVELGGPVDLIAGQYGQNGSDDHSTRPEGGSLRAKQRREEITCG